MTPEPDFKELCERTLAYEELIKRVREIDPEAADYMDGPARELKTFYPADTLNWAFTWGDTPQGHEYWRELHMQAIASHFIWRYHDNPNMW